MVEARLLIGGISSEVVIEPLECVPNKRQAHLGALVLRGDAGGGGSGAGSLRGFEEGGVVCLVDLVSWEVGRVDVRCQARFEGCADPAQAVEFDAPEEVVALDLVRSASSETILRVADEARQCLSASAALRGSLQSWLGTYLRIRFSASTPSWISSGKYRDWRQFTIFRYVSWLSSAQNGGQPTRHSNMMVPRDHQSQSNV